MTGRSASYKQAGVDYDALDAGKRLAMARALATSPLLAARGGRALDASRGEPAFAFDFDGRTLAFVMEGLGTKSIVARQVLERHNIDRFADVAYDTVAAILNDLCCVGALPLVVNAYFATGSSEWYGETTRRPRCSRAGTAPALDAGCVWGGGESPSLAGLVSERDIELAGGAVGACHPPLGRSSAKSSRRATRSCSSPPPACTPTAPRSPGCRRRLPDGYATPLPAAAPSARRCSTPRSCTCRSSTAARLRAAGLLHQPHHRPRPAEADAPAQAAHLRISSFRPSPRCWHSSCKRPNSTPQTPTRRSTWAPATPSTARPGAGPAVVEPPESSAWRRSWRARWSRARAR